LALQSFAGRPTDGGPVAGPIARGDEVARLFNQGRVAMKRGNCIGPFTRRQDPGRAAHREAQVIDQVALDLLSERLDGLAGLQGTGTTFQQARRVASSNV
jgi:hypothetical protein